MTKKKSEAIKDPKRQIEDLENKYKRALADYQNLVKRTEKERAEYLKFAISCLITKFLNILDQLEKASEHLKDEGLDLIIRDFKGILKEEGVVEIESLGQEFNPAVHECLEVVKVDKKMANRIVKEIRKGYQIGDRVIRHAQVKVGKEEIPPETEKAKEASRFGKYM